MRTPATIQIKSYDSEQYEGVIYAWRIDYKGHPYYVEYFRESSGKEPMQKNVRLITLDGKFNEVDEVTEQEIIAQIDQWRRSRACHPSTK